MSQSISIPEGLAFSDLALSRNPQTGDIEFDWAPIAQICAHNGIDPVALARVPGDVAGLVASWYAQHRRAGGASDPVYAELIGEVDGPVGHA